MFDAVTDEALRLRRRGLAPAPPEAPGKRTSLVCSVCRREMGPEEPVFWVAREPHCGQCHGMLEHEYGAERRADRELRERGTRWDRGNEG